MILLQASIIWSAGVVSVVQSGRSWDASGRGRAPPTAGWRAEQDQEQAAHRASSGESRQNDDGEGTSEGPGNP